MSFTIPDKGEGFNDFQSVLMQSDLNALVAGIQGDGVITGCAVSQDVGGASMDLDVSAGEVVISRLAVAVTGGLSAVTIGAADATNPRIDIVTVDNGGTLSVTAGTAAASPKAPDIPAGEILLAMVFIPANDTAITDAQITDKRVSSPLRAVTLFESTLASPGRFDASSLSQNYDHMILTALVRGSVAANSDSTRLYLNNDTTDANYRIIHHYGVYSGSFSDTGGIADAPYIGGFPGATATANYFGGFEIEIPLYKSTNHQKIARWKAFWREDSTVMRVQHGTLHWENTAAISRVTFQPDGYSTDNFVANSYLQIVGVR